MSLTHYRGIDPFQDFEEMWKRFPVLLSFPSTHMNQGFLPAVDMYETGDAVMIETVLPGIDPRDVSVSVENSILTIEGETSKKQEVEEKNYYRKEIRTGSFCRQIPLPVPVKSESVTAEFVDGVLKITAPKLTKNTSKKIEVNIIKKDGKKNA